MRRSAATLWSAADLSPLFASGGLAPRCCYEMGSAHEDCDRSQRPKRRQVGALQRVDSASCSTETRPGFLVSSDYEKLCHRPAILIAAHLSLSAFPATEAYAQSWTAKLDNTVRFYQTTELGVVLVGTEKSLYAIDGSGLAGVNIHISETGRKIRLRDLDERFFTDEALGLMFVSNGNRMLAYSLAGAR